MQMPQSWCKTTQQAAEKVQFLQQSSTGVADPRGMRRAFSALACFIELAVLFFSRS
jgi:hypothetical protein